MSDIETKEFPSMEVNMESGVHHVENLKSRGVAPLVPDRFYQDCLATLGSAGKDVAMVLDDRGKVLYCGNEGAAIIGSLPGELVGMHLSEIVPDLRLSAWSPGSNVAYASFIGRRNQWREYSVLGTDRRAYPLELLLDVVVVNLRYLILLWFRTPTNLGRSREQSIAWLPVSETSAATGSRQPCCVD